MYLSFSLYQQQVYAESACHEMHTEKQAGEHERNERWDTSRWALRHFTPSPETCYTEKRCTESHWERHAECHTETYSLRPSHTDETPPQSIKTALRAERLKDQSKLCQDDDTRESMGLLASKWYENKQTESHNDTPAEIQQWATSLQHRSQPEIQHSLPSHARPASAETLRVLLSNPPSSHKSSVRVLIIATKFFI